MDKTIIACEANSRFTFFVPVICKLSLSELTDSLQMEWQSAFAETLNYCRLLPNLDIAFLLSKLSDIDFDIDWVKNTDLSINGHISDAGLWVTETLEDQRLYSLTPEVATGLAIHLNTQTKRIKKRKEKFIPVERLLEYCMNITSDDAQCKPVSTNNIINLNDYRSKWIMPFDSRRNCVEFIADQKIYITSDNLYLRFSIVFLIIYFLK